jgi:colicin import membrane protein
MKLVAPALVIALGSILGVATARADDDIEVIEPPAALTQTIDTCNDEVRDAIANHRPLAQEVQVRCESADAEAAKWNRMAAAHNRLLPLDALKGRSWSTHNASGHAGSAHDGWASFGRAEGGDDGDAPVATHAEGVYSGVRTGGPAPTETAPRAATKALTRGPNSLRWLGFEARGETGLVFAVTPKACKVSQRIEGSTLVVVLEGVRAGVANTRRPIDTHFFATPVARISSGARSKRGVELRIELKPGQTPHEAAVRTAVEPDGGFYVYVDVAPTATASP